MNYYYFMILIHVLNNNKMILPLIGWHIFSMKVSKSGIFFLKISKHYDPRISFLNRSSIEDPF